MAATQVLALRDWAQPVRTYGPSLLAELPDPHAELLALVWGPRFDREHAQLCCRATLHCSLVCSNR
ncbi:MAG: hypothetical protein IPF55_14005 [Rhodoferax sp.]|jgi:hypothetical protein|nr:hypothetical protein [Rhodoferax sp.]